MIYSAWLETCSYKHDAMMNNMHAGRAWKLYDGRPLYRIRQKQGKSPSAR